MPRHMPIFSEAEQAETQQETQGRQVVSPASKMGRVLTLLAALGLMMLG